METLYDILEVSRKASKEIIEKAYRTLAKRYHPDLQTPENKAYAEEKMKKINEAYNILSDDEKRREYDMQLESAEIQKEEARNKAQVDNYYYANDTGQTTPNNNQKDYTYNGEHTEYDWRRAYANLSKRQQKKVMKNIQKEANSEYRKLYEDYFKRLGYTFKHKWTLKEFMAIVILILMLIIIFSILWLIPNTRESMTNLYNENFFIRIIVNILVGIYQGIVKFIKSITKF